MSREQSTSTVVKKKGRPTGEDLSRYKRIHNWSYHQWAWEFLRRNPEFIAACESVQDLNDDNLKQDVAERFGLRKYKYYKDSYKAKPGKPQFALGSIRSLSNIDSTNANRSPKLQIASGQVIIKFDLAAALEDREALAKQLRIAERRLQKRLAEYAANLRRKVGVHKPKPLKYGAYIRLLDLLNEGQSDVYCAELLVAELKGEAKIMPSQAKRKLRHPKESAMQLADKGYRYLALLPGKPEGKGIPLCL